jgi:hypothetical protein
LERNAELLVYLVEEEKDVYIGGCPVPPRPCSAGLSPAESFSYLAVAESLRTGKWRPRRGLYGIEKDRGKDLETLPYIFRCTANSEKGLGLFLGRHLFLDSRRRRCRLFTLLYTPGSPAGSQTLTMEVCNDLVEGLLVEYQAHEVFNRLLKLALVIQRL